MRIAAAAIIPVCTILASCAAGGDFDYDSPIGDGPVGSIIAQEEMKAPDNAKAYRILYRSTDPGGAAIAVSGVVVIPDSDVPSGGRPIVAWAHPTSGVVPKCAPSRAQFFMRQVQGLKELLDQGYIVAATDYPGLGTPGPHPYLVGESEARAVIDSVRAARSLSDAAASNQFAVWGHSQGGQATLFTGLAAGRYAPELQLVGVAVAAPATELKTLLMDDINTDGGRNLTAMTFYSWSRLYGLSLDGIVDPKAMPAVDALSNECIENAFDLIERGVSQRPLRKVFLDNDNFANISPWSDLLAKNTPGPLPKNIPVFVAQGTADQLVRPEVTQNYVQTLCKAGLSVQYVPLPGVTHAWAAKQSAAQSSQWIADRFAGAPAPNGCTEIPAQ